MTKYKDGPNGYALYFYKGLWKESASVKNEDIERLNKGSNNDQSNARRLLRANERN